ncbi:hypothetical protein ACHHYP_04638 [Achlya hypogyna]|uniref:Uncharacterized protein n=1 Tax=Achlya hypogyna TaxID=1202772 RepID=A0A1V9ZP01_ACHHY|nr:hypothetical protein ACHHYP_04638 [Achlya hypogyna]
MLQDVRAVAHEMAHLVRGSFGPTGDEMLLFCAPEAPLLTSSAYTIFHYADKGSARSNPIKQLLLQTLRSLYNEVGDGVTQLTLMLDLALTEMERLRHVQKSMHAWAMSYAALHHRLPALYEAVLAPYFDPVSVVFEPFTRKPSTALLGAARNIARTSLAGAFSAPAVAYLSDMTIDWIFRTVEEAAGQRLPNSSQGLAAITALVLAQAKVRLLQLPTGNLDQSQIVRQGAYFLRNPSYARSHDLTLGSTTQRFVLFDGSLDGGEAAVDVTVEVDSAAALGVARSLTRLALEKYLLTLVHDHRVDLILCTGSAPVQVLDICRRHGITCFPYVEKDDLVGLAERTGVQYVASVHDRITAAHVGAHAGPLRTMRVGGVLYSVFSNLPVGPGEAPSVPQLLLHGPSKGMTQQYYYAIKKALRVLHAWCEDGRSLGGGLAPEIALARHLHATAAKDDVAAAVLVQALMAGWAELQGNLSGRCDRASKARYGILQLSSLDHEFTGCIYAKRVLVSSPALGTIESHHLAGHAAFWSCC